MKITPIAHGLDLAKPTEGYVRTPGLHASDLYGSFYRSFDPARYDKRRGEDGEPLGFDTTKMELGIGFEEVLERTLAERLLGARPGEFVSPEGIIYSPDYLFSEDDLILGEFKLTWYSSRGAPTDEKFSKWLTQIKLYCHWLEIRRARLYVLFVNGDYKPPTPALLAWELVFTPRELQDEADMILRHGRSKGMIQ